MVDKLLNAAGCVLGALMLVLAIASIGMIAQVVVNFASTYAIDFHKLLVAGVLLMVVGIYVTRN